MKLYSHKPIEVYETLKKKYKDYLIFIRCGCFYDLMGEDAEWMNEHFDWKLYERRNLPYTGTGEYSLDTIKEKLREINRKYIIVEQDKIREVVERKVVEIYPN